MATQDDVPLITEMDIEALLEQELNDLYVHDFYLLDHLIDINSKVKEQQDRMDAVRDEATRIFSFAEQRQILLDRQQSETVLDKAFEQVVEPTSTQQSPVTRRKNLLLIRRKMFLEPLPRRSC